ncbi:protein TESPA1 isoform X1 [Ranitomeya imitator]|uniref:protein TESPA1 isoform X1 n=1 Tax=Ranitomeya imitator TaxID=111125 RepID=UPI0037E7DD01
MNIPLNLCYKKLCSVLCYATVHVITFHSVISDFPYLTTMNLDNSITSNTTTKTSSSISDVLAFCQPDAETVLYNLGFACEKACSTYKIPSRFFFIPSKAEGIDFTMYFESLLHRMKRGDSSYIPAGDLNMKNNYLSRRLRIPE